MEPPMNNFDVYYEWNGELRVLEKDFWIGNKLTEVPESVEYFGQSLYPYVHTAHITVVDTCELAESEEGVTYIHIEGKTTESVKLRAPAWKYYVWITIVVPVMWLADNVQAFVAMLDRREF